MSMPIELRALPYKLTPRERDAIVMLGKLMGGDKAVAAALGISCGTVKVYFTRIRQNLTAQGFDVNSRYKFITWAREHMSELEAE